MGEDTSLQEDNNVEETKKEKFTLSRLAASL
jgi:hypothetical protein